MQRALWSDEVIRDCLLSVQERSTKREGGGERRRKGGGRRKSGVTHEFVCLFVRVRFILRFPHMWRQSRLQHVI